MTDIASSASEPDTSTSRAASEYERERVPNSALKGPSAFWGMYAGEHTAGTEFMIGPLFVAWGADAASLIFGLLLGNLLAVLTWRYLTAQIACSDRLTLYYTMERIAGRGLVTLYNLANGLLFCFLAGSMITVSATAVGPLFPPGMIEMPTFESTLPTGIAWILSCVVIGSLMTLVALKGYGVVAQVGHYAAPWMFLVFVACALVTLGKLGTTDIWQLLTPPAGTEQKIWLHRAFGVFASYLPLPCAIACGLLYILLAMRAGLLPLRFLADPKIGRILVAAVLHDKALDLDVAQATDVGREDPPTGRDLHRVVLRAGRHAVGPARKMDEQAAGGGIEPPGARRSGEFPLEGHLREDRAIHEHLPEGVDHVGVGVLCKSLSTGRSTGVLRPAVAAPRRG